MNTKIIAIAVLLLVGLPLVTYVMHYISASANVVANEIEPSIIQQKYEWFQNQKAAIDNADTNIRIQINAAKAKKSDQNRSDWDRTDKEQFSRSIDDIGGVIALRNGLVRDYNSAMSQWQMSFANLGSWPKGAKYQKTDFDKFPNEVPEYNYGEEMKDL